ncbi:MAG: SDR family oxidoreductase [Myxococcota bacterium]
MDIKGKTVLVTGANRGIGREFVEELIALGAGRIYAAARSKAAVQDLAEKDARVTPLELDITSDAAIHAAKQQVSALDLLINNAGTLKSFSLLEATREQLDHDLGVNFYGTLNLTKAFAPALASSKGGVLNVLTLVSMASMAGIGGYSASKAAAWSMTQALRTELGKKGVKVFAVYPGAVDTDMIRGFEMDKTPPREVAKNSLAAVQADELDSFPDPMSKQAGGAWLKNPRALEDMFASM